jgi:amicoumacin kinase
LQEAALRYDINVSDIKKIGGYENQVFEYTKDHQAYILRIGHSEHRTNFEVQAELDFIEYLFKNNANVSMPIYSNQGHLVEVIPINQEDYFILSVFHKALGEPFSKNHQTDIVFENLGKTIGQFHALTKSYTPSLGSIRRKQWYEDDLIVNAEQLLPKEDYLILERLNEVISEIHQLEINDHTYGLIHGDIHFWNFFVHENQPSIFDFDDITYFYFLSDLAIVIFYYIMNVEDEKTRKTMIESMVEPLFRGYHKEHELPSDSYEKIDLFLELRAIILYLVIHQNKVNEFGPWELKYLSFYRKRIIERKRHVDVDFTVVSNYK